VEFFPQGKYSKAIVFYGHTTLKRGVFPQGKYSKAIVFYGHTLVLPYFKAWSFSYKEKYSMLPYKIAGTIILEMILKNSFLQWNHVIVYSEMYYSKR